MHIRRVAPRDSNANFPTLGQGSSLPLLASTPTRSHLLVGWGRMAGIGVAGLCLALVFNTRGPLPFSLWPNAGEGDGGLTLALSRRERHTPRPLEWSLGPFRGTAPILPFRTAFRFGLPLDDPFEGNLGSIDDRFVMITRPHVLLSIGTIGWLQFDPSSFRELAGVRFPRIDAVPGLRLGVRRVGVEAGAGVLVSTTDASRVERLRSYTGLFQLLGHF